MPILPIVKDVFPKVPQVAGVPAVLRGGAQIFDTLTLGFFGAGDLINQIIGSEPVRWGVFDEDGKPIAKFDSMFSLSYDNSSRVADYPVENGSFAAYNKVENPFTVQVVLSCGGSQEVRNTFQNALKDASRSLKLYTVLTEDGVYTNCNLVGLGWQRTAQRGAQRVEAYCDFQEIRQKGNAAFSQPQQPSGAADIDQGQLQPIDDVTADLSDIA